jgi:phage-related protein
MPILSESEMSRFELKTRYVRNYLTFAGKNSKDYLLYISGPGVYDSPSVDVELQAIPGKNGDLIRDNAKAGEHRYKNLDITTWSSADRLQN